MDRFEGEGVGRNRGDLTPLSCDNEAAAAYRRERSGYPVTDEALDRSLFPREGRRFAAGQIPNSLRGPPTPAPNPLDRCLTTETAVAN